MVETSKTQLSTTGDVDGQTGRSQSQAAERKEEKLRESMDAVEPLREGNNVGQKGTSPSQIKPGSCTPE